MYQAKYKIKIAKNGYDEMETINSVSFKPGISFVSKKLSKKNNITHICLRPYAVNSVSQKKKSDA